MSEAEFWLSLLGALAVVLVGQGAWGSLKSFMEQEDDPDDHTWWR